MSLTQDYKKKSTKAISVLIIATLSTIIPIFILKNAFIIFSFQLLVFSILYHLWLSITSKYLSITNIFINIFYIHFFLIAPLIQLSYSEGFLVNTFPAKEDLIFYTNILLSIFIFISSLVYFESLKKHKINTPFFMDIKINVQLNEKLVKALFCLSVLFLAPRFINDILERLGSITYKEIDSESKIVNLIWSKSVKQLPLYFLCVFTLIKSLKQRFLWQFLALIFVLLAKNPIVEHRNGFGAAVAVAFFLFLTPYLRNIRFAYIISTLLFPILFSAGVFLAPHRFKQSSFLQEVATSYNTIHFDAWANLCAGIAFINERGFYFGKQIISGILFWFPRSVWKDKGSGTGQELGDFLMQTENMWFNNISSVLPLEGYADFGVFGVLLFSFLLGKLLSKSDIYIFSPKILLKIIGLFLSCSVIFVYRGPFLSSFAFTFGGIIGLIITHYIVKTLNKILKTI